MSKTKATCGSWKSPISSALIVEASVGLSELQVVNGSTYWLELRPSEGGRYVIVKEGDGDNTDMIPKDFNSRNRVHEYGGASYVVLNDGKIAFSNFNDQRLYVVEESDPSKATALTVGGDLHRYADAIYDGTRDCIFSIREDHVEGQKEPANCIAKVALTADGEHKGSVVASGNDFYANPRLSSDGKMLSFVTWNHPSMSWFSSELWVVYLDEAGEATNKRKIGGKMEGESVGHPVWSKDGHTLYFVSDKDGWWRLYKCDVPTSADAPLDVHPVVTEGLPPTAEFCRPEWRFGNTQFIVRDDGSLITTYTCEGFDVLGSVDKAGKLSKIDIPYTTISNLNLKGERLVFLAGSATRPVSVVSCGLDGSGVKEHRRANDHHLALEGYLSVPRPVTYPSANGRKAHAFFYPPANKEFEGTDGEKPPLLVKIHGGPTAATTSSFNLSIQYWTSRGFAVLDVNYGGSTGYGREYRLLLNRSWGIVDVDDCCYGAKYLAEQGDADENRLCIDGGSAGGYTTLAALTFHDVFKAGASHYGICDLEVLAGDTHKFESRYLDTLIGPYPEDKAVYVERSPCHFFDKLSCPLAIFQGTEDKVVPPNQAEKMYEMLKSKGHPVALVMFEGEQHGFRQAPNIRRALDGEIFFYGRVFGFEADIGDQAEPLTIDNL